MAYIELDDGSIIGTGFKPYIVAELNSSHFGDVSIAKKMIDSAKECGCDCVKFQSWSAETLYSSDYYKENPISKRVVKKFSLNEDELLECYEYCKKIGIGFASTPYSEKEVDFLCDRVDVPFIKIASMEINNIPFLEYIAKKNKAIILSTGMADVDEIKNAVEAISLAGNDRICILHCVSSYPAQYSVINLNNINMFKNVFSKYPIGYSDHSIGAEVASGAVALGACFIEKHFTLDNSKIGMDNNMATEPQDMKKLVESCHNVFNAMGNYERVVTEEDINQRLKMRRSIIAIKDIKKGDIISAEKLGFKRPGDGIPPDKISCVVGKKAKKDLEADYIINECDFE